MAEGYRTRQRTLVLSLLKRLGDRHLTAEEISRYLAEEGNPVGKATVYRCLDRLVEQGTVRKFPLGEGESACYQYQTGECHSHYHLKCACCGALLHLECSYIDGMAEHLKATHGFLLDPSKIVLYGLCGKCAAEKKEKL